MNTSSPFGSGKTVFSQALDGLHFHTQITGNRPRARTLFVCAIFRSGRSTPHAYAKRAGGWFLVLNGAETARHWPGTPSRHTRSLLNISKIQGLAKV